MKALSIRDERGVPLERFVKTVRVLDIHDTDEEEAIDLSTFPNLSVLRVTLNEYISPTMLSTLSTVASSTTIRTIIIGLDFYDASQGYRRSLLRSQDPALDSILSTLPMANPPTIELEAAVDKTSYETVMRRFPACKARDMLRVVRCRESDTWWKDLLDSV
ncbi:hypothetical protein B0H11DRAFT_2268154 [Mycena galericulata]|nr:hypothetical protein B0H11DRAFT_2268154 [Mycena galericulata]